MVSLKAGQAPVELSAKIGGAKLGFSSATFA